jgi:hypothetical protein
MKKHPATLIPFIIPSFLATNTNLLNPSATNKNKNGDKVQPCLRPLEELKKHQGSR